VEQDSQIITLCRRGRQEGFATLLLAYQERVYRRAFSFVQNRDDALDLTQEVFLRTIRGVQNLAPDRPLWPWLRRITTNLCLNFVRDRHPAVPLDEALPSTDEADPQEAALAAWHAGEVSAAVADLPPLYRMAVVLRHQEDLSYEEIARLMELPLGTVKTYLFRARRLLKQRLLQALEG